MTPGYSGVMGKLWLERGGTMWSPISAAAANSARPGIQAGLKENRQKVYDDFFAVSQDLITRKITSPRRLGIMGGSNGGLLMGVALTQRPELYNAIVVQVPLFDMIRYSQIGAGASWVGEYGDPAIPSERAVIAKYDPYSNLKAGQKYPEVFIETSTKDDRVHPAHARKAAARLMELGYPVLYYENVDGGHAAGGQPGRDRPAPGPGICVSDAQADGLTRPTPLGSPLRDVAASSLAERRLVNPKESYRRHRLRADQTS